MTHYLQIIDQSHFYQQSPKYWKKSFSNNFMIFSYKINYFNTSQYGFRTEHSTEFAALEVIDRILV